MCRAQEHRPKCRPTRAPLKDWLGERGLDPYWPMLDEHEATSMPSSSLNTPSAGDRVSVGARLKLLKAIAEHRNASLAWRRLRRAASKRNGARSRRCSATLSATQAVRADRSEEDRRLLHSYWQRIEEVTASIRFISRSISAMAH